MRSPLLVPLARTAASNDSIETGYVCGTTTSHQTTTQHATLVLQNYGREARLGGSHHLDVRPELSIGVSDTKDLLELRVAVFAIGAVVV